MSDFILIKDLTKSLYFNSGIKKNIVKNLSFRIPITKEGSITTIVAPYGAGKTTLLKIISGVDKYDSGTIEILNSENKAIPLIPENNSNLPWLNVEKNILTWLNFKKEKLPETVITKIIANVGLSNYNKFHPKNVNSGFQFRIALARALTLSPKITLIDDTFKEFDIETRNEIYSMLIDIKNKYNVQFIIATTNIIEAVFLSDRILLMSKNPAQIIFEKVIEEKFVNPTEMLKSAYFNSISGEIQNQFNKNSGIALINYSV